MTSTSQTAARVTEPMAILGSRVGLAAVLNDRSSVQDRPRMFQGESFGPQEPGRPHRLPERVEWLFRLRFSSPPTATLNSSRKKFSKRGGLSDNRPVIRVVPVQDPGGGAQETSAPERQVRQASCGGSRPGNS